MMFARTVWISGKVQKVGYRAFVKQTAITYQLKGFACNHPDGRVEVLFVGASIDDIDLAIETLKKGPPQAQIEHVIAFSSSEPTTLSEDFLICSKF
ncbi:MAG: acylphosphatase [Pseudomonadota bacterium]